VAVAKLEDVGKRLALLEGNDGKLLVSIRQESVMVPCWRPLCSL